MPSFTFAGDGPDPDSVAVSDTFTSSSSERPSAWGDGSGLADAGTACALLRARHRVQRQTGTLGHVGLRAADSDPRRPDGSGEPARAVADGQRRFA
jgi:hypothetical protein